MKRDTKKSKTKKTETLKKDTKKKSEMSSKELDAVAGGSKNIDHPGVRAAVDAFNRTVKDAEAARLELLRNSGGSLGSTPKI